MSEAPKHTPGPWHRGGLEVYGGESNAAIASVSLGHHLTPSWEAEANACLIAAAPDLGRELAALCPPGVVAWIPIIWNGVSQVPGNTIHSEGATAALRKAGLLPEGE